MNLRDSSGVADRHKAGTGLRSGKNSKSRFQMNDQIPSRTEVKAWKFLTYGMTVKKRLRTLIQPSPTNSALQFRSPYKTLPSLFAQLPPVQIHFVTFAIFC
jgi:hypothetical protein